MKFLKKITGLIKYNKTNQYDWHDNWHEDFIIQLAKITRPTVYVELGLFQCSLFNSMIPYAGQLLGVDIDPNAGNYMKKTPKTTFFNMNSEDFAQKD
jgi:hypothetical protein